ncbi:damage-control phosphatase ARMT1-like [Paramacrobiotus metropolitanus]|uniref:damage-control phosphatase ARMT1-like n=1 Tax=Paramacrobiotus metropolitanus TaxID=2943436 RepID=UPI0024462A3E|nr:damage-control phosphatase ARMT1-like [Paramacrobiotus metropolitanus]
MQCLLVLGFLLGSAVSAPTTGNTTLQAENVVDSLRFYDPRQRFLPPFWWAETPGTNAHFTVEKRLPAVLAGVLADYKLDVESLKNDSIPVDIAGQLRIERSLAELQQEMTDNAPIREFPLGNNSSVGDDLAEWNWALQRSLAWNQRNESDVPRWYDSPTTFVECYFYRRLSYIFERESWTTDHFHLKKKESLEHNMHNIQALLDYLENTLEAVAASHNRSDPLVKEHLMNIMRLSVWGNKGDLSLTATHNKSSHVVSHDFHDEQQQIQELLLVDQSEAIWSYLQRLNRSAHIAIICDNFGFELTTDLILGEFLIVSGLVATVHYHVKALPWFVSDVIIPDFHRTLRMVDQQHTGQFGTKWQGYLTTGQFKLSADRFWTLPYDYDVMDVKAPGLYAQLQKEDLLIFKGDLNYRKLTGELRWSPQEKFGYVLRNFRPTAVAALRGVKTTVLVGVTDQERLQQLNANETDWMLTGKYSVIQFAPPLTQ